LRSSGRYDCFARELRDYCDYPVALYVEVRASPDRDSNVPLRHPLKAEDVEGLFLG
jgi:hypothetical protein